MKFWAYALECAVANSSLKLYNSHKQKEHNFYSPLHDRISMFFSLLQMAYKSDFNSCIIHLYSNPLYLTKCFFNDNAACMTGTFNAIVKMKNSIDK